MATNKGSEAETRRASRAAKTDVSTAAAEAPGTVHVLRRKEFVERIAASSGLKPNAVKSVLDAVLKELGDALSNGESLNMPPLGKLSVNRRKDGAKSEVMICKLRRPTGAPAANDATEPLAEPAE